MNSKPKFILTRVYEDGTRDEPKIVDLAQAIHESKMTRRGFLGVGLTAAAVLATLDSNAIVGADKWNTQSTPRPTDKECGKRYAHSNDVTTLALGKDGFFLASGSKDGTIKFWRMEDYALVHTLKTNMKPEIAVGTDDDMMICGTTAGEIELRNLPAGKLLKNMKGNIYAISANGELLVVANKDKLTFYYINDNEESEPLSAGVVKAIAVSPNAKCVAINYETKNSIALFDGDGELIKDINCNANMTAMTFSPDGRRLVGRNGDTFVVIRVSDGKELYKGVLPKGIDVASLLHAPIGEEFLTDGDATLLHEIATKTNALAMAFTPDGDFVITGGIDGSIKLWRLPDLTFFNCLMDINCSGEQQKGITYNYTDEWGQTLTFTLPCGSPLPPGAKCICNCVPGKLENVCTCNTVCTCNKVCTCNPQQQRYCSCDKVCTCNPQQRRYCSCDRVCVCLAV